MRKTRRLLAVLTTIVLAVSCGTRQPERPRLEPLPSPDLTTAERQVKEQLESERQTLDDLLESKAENAELAVALGRMGQLYHAYDLLEAAQACYRNARLLAADDSRWIYLLGLTYERQGRNPEAAETLQAALETLPDDGPTLLHLGQVELTLNEMDGAAQHFAAALEAEPTCHAARFGLAEVARSRGDLEEAARRYQEILQAQPEAELVHYPLSQVLLRLGRQDEAQVHLDHVANRALKVGGRPYCPDPLDLELAELRTGTAAAVRRGLLLGLAGESEQEIELLREAIDKAPEDHVARLRLGVLMLRRGEIEEARSQFEEASRLAPENPEIISYQGIAFIRMKRPDLAEQKFRQALTMHPTSAHYQRQLAATVQQLGNCSEAVELYSRALETEPGHRQALLQRSFCLEQLGRLTEAAEDMSVLLEVDPPEDPVEHLHLASMLFSLGKEETALRHFRLVAASQAPPEVRAQAQILIGRTLLQRGDSTGAEESFRTASALDPMLPQPPPNE